MTNLYMITDINTNETSTINLDAEGYYRALDVLNKQNRIETRYIIERVETNKALKA